MSIQVLELLIDSSLKSVVLLAATWVMAAALRRSSAAARHLTWTIGVVCTLLLPITSAALPHWRVSVMPAVGSVFSDETGSIAADPFGNSLRSASVAPLEVSQQSAHQDPVRPVIQTRRTWSRIKFDSADWILAGWILAGSLVMSPWLLSVLYARRLARRAAPLGCGTLRRECDEIQSAMRLERRVMLLESQEHLAPLTWGTLRPRILFPIAAREWPADKRRHVLLHELAHVCRWDCATQMLAQLACALYWSNPFAWLAARAMRLEREQAADDAVIRDGHGAVNYAAYLLEIVRSLRPPGLPRFAAVAVVRQSQLSQRLRALLDPDRDHRRVDRRSALAGLLLAAMALLPLSMLRGQAPQPTTTIAPPHTSVGAPSDRVATQIELVTNGNYYLERAASSISDNHVIKVNPSDYERDGAQAVTLIIFDRYTPTRPQALPSIYFGAVPADGRFKEVASTRHKDIGVAQFDSQHPIMSHVSDSRIYAAEMLAIEPPPDAKVLIRGDQGPMVIYDASGPGTVCVTFDVLQSNWPLRVSFPVFLNNALLYLTGDRAAPRPTTTQSNLTTQPAHLGEKDAEPVGPQTQNAVKAYFSR